MTTTTAQKLDEILDQTDNLESLCTLFYDQKNRTIYKSIAASLRLLLTGSSGDEGLVSETLPGVCFSPLAIVPLHRAQPDHLTLPASVEIVSGDATVRLGAGCGVKELNVAGGAVNCMSWGEIFDDSKAPLLLQDWLDQPFLRPDRTLANFLKTVGNKDGVAHFNPTADLEAMQRWGYFHWHLIAGIARSVRPQILAQANSAFPGHVRTPR